MGQALRGIFAVSLLAAVGCGTLSVEEEKKLGRSAQRQIRNEVQLFRDRVVVNYVRKLGEVLVRSAKPSPFEFRFFVVEDEELNAFAVPGGAIYIHTGLILETKNVAELVGVMAHEIGHVTARHVAKIYRRQRNTGFGANVVAIAIAILTGNPYIANAGGLVTDIAATAYTTTFTRDAEREADTLALETMLAAEYDPNALVTMFQTLQEEAGKGFMPGFLSSHPLPADRIQKVRTEIATSRQPRGLRLDDGGRLEIIQERIRLLLGTDAPEEDPE